MPRRRGGARAKLVLHRAAEEDYCFYLSEQGAKQRIAPQLAGLYFTWHVAMLEHVVPDVYADQLRDLISRLRKWIGALARQSIITLAGHSLSQEGMK